jgi:predicted RNase H-like HicB family nuclease
VISKEERWYVGHCVELGVVSQGKTIEEARANLKEAVELYIESFGTEHPPESKGRGSFVPARGCGQSLGYPFFPARS